MAGRNNAPGERRINTSGPGRINSTARGRECVCERESERETKIKRKRENTREKDRQRSGRGKAGPKVYSRPAEVVLGRILGVRGGLDGPEVRQEIGRAHV